MFQTKADRCSAIPAVLAPCINRHTQQLVFPDYRVVGWPPIEAPALANKQTYKLDEGHQSASSARSLVQNSHHYPTTSPPLPQDIHRAEVGNFYAIELLCSLPCGLRQRPSVKTFTCLIPLCLQLIACECCHFCYSFHDSSTILTPIREGG